VSFTEITDNTNSEELNVDVILAQDFVLMEFAVVVEILRLANRILSFQKFKWKFYSENAGNIGSRSGASVETDVIPKKPRPDYVVFIGNSDPFYKALDVEKYAARYRHSGARVILLAEAASRYIASNHDNATEHTTHWENRTLLEEKQGIYGIKSSLAVTDGQIITSAGMSTTADIMLALVGQHISSAKLLIVSRILLHDEIRAFDTLQPEMIATVQKGTRTLNKAIKIMQMNIEEPVTISDLADEVGHTTRWLERNFKSVMGCSPAKYYRELRLNHAHSLLLNTSMSIHEIALASGYQSGFSIAYRQCFGKTPNKMRKG
jgi:transcriptional regulator GlxA family with amidase domain